MKGVSTGWACSDYYDIALYLSRHLRRTDGRTLQPQKHLYWGNVQDAADASEVFNGFRVGGMLLLRIPK